MTPERPGDLECSEVLDLLSDYLDDELPGGRRASVEEHLRGCDACTRFGGELAVTLKALRAHLLAPRAEAQLGPRVGRAIRGSR